MRFFISRQNLCILYIILVPAWSLVQYIILVPGLQYFILSVSLVSGTIYYHGPWYLVLYIIRVPGPWYYILSWFLVPCTIYYSGPLSLLLYVIQVLGHWNNIISWSLERYIILFPGLWSMVHGIIILFPGLWSLVPSPWSLLPELWCFTLPYYRGPWSLVLGPWYVTLFQSLGHIINSLHASLQYQYQRFQSESLIIETHNQNINQNIEGRENIKIYFSYQKILRFNEGKSTDQILNSARDSSYQCLKI